MSKFIKAHKFTDTNQKIAREPIITDFKFKKYKFGKRQRPVQKNTCIFPMFAEFGCEILGVLYCLPQLLRNKYKGKYSIVLGWHGREYLYRHLVDEFWELGEEYQWLREYCRAFHHESKNLKKLENEAASQGIVVPLDDITNIAVYPPLLRCPNNKCPNVSIINNSQVCTDCGFRYPNVGLFYRARDAKQEAVWVPAPGAAALVRAAKYLPPNAVGITARKRMTYGRNLQPIFYERLIYLLEDMGYQVVWMGERSTTLPCPFKRIVNFSESTDADDLETTLALVSQLQFTVQCWTASTRLAGLTGTPFIIVESPEQLYGSGQEGIRLNLCSKGPKKIVISHFRSVYEDNTAGLALIKRAIADINCGDYRDIVGLVEDIRAIELLRASNLRRVGGV